MFGTRLVRAFEEVKDRFDPENRLNPGKIVRPISMSDRSVMRYPPGYRVVDPVKTVLDWSDWGGFGAAVEMCNNNGTCRRTLGGTMCPLVPGDPDGAARDPGACEFPASCHHGATRARRVHVGRDEGDAGSLRVLQGLQARMPDRRRHGQDEGRVPFITIMPVTGSR
jgi:hypothetical protein